MEALDAASTSPLPAMADPGSSSSLDVIFDAQKDPDPDSLKVAIQVPITVMLGPMGPLLRKLGSPVASDLLSVGEIRLLKVLCISLAGMSEDEGASFMARWWMKMLRELCYDTDDHLEEVIDGGSAHHNFSALLARAKDACEKRKCFQWSPSKTIKPAEQVEAGVSHLTSPELPVPLPVHMELPKKLVELLALDDYEKKLKVIPIHGCAGVGKTTAARTLYYKHGGKFQCRAFITASRNPYMRGLLTSMLSQLKDSQLKAPWPDGFTDVPDLIAAINKHLQGKRYFIVIDDLWTASVWNIISRALPRGDSCSRIITTTQIDDVALECCGYYPVYIYKMEPLNDYKSLELFFGIKEVSNTLKEKLKHKQYSEQMKDVLDLIYSSLPPRLRTCLLYLCMYQQGYVIKKDELVKHWVAEGFLSAVGGGDTEEIAEGSFDELVSRGMVQAVDITNNGKVLSCSVHQIVLDFVRHKSREENFVITVDYNQSALALPDKVRRLSVQFGGVKCAYIPESIVTSHVRSLIFWGFFKGLPSSFMDYGLLRILILQIWADKDNETVDLTGIGELFLLKYLKIECNICVKLPGEIRRLQQLEVMELDTTVVAVPSDIGNLKKLMHLRLRSEYLLPSVVAHMTSLRTLGYFDLSTHSEENVLHLEQLSNLHDLQLTCSTVQLTENLERNVQPLGSIIETLRNLQSVTLVPASASSNVNIPQDDDHATSISIPVDGFTMVSPPPDLLLRKIELSRRCCVFFSLPKWFGELSKLCILKIGVRRLSMDDTDILKGMPALAALTLYIETAPAENIVIDKGGFKVLTYFKFMCSAPCLSFVQGAMPKLQKLKQGFNSNKWKPNTFLLAGFRNLIGLTELFVKIGVRRAEEFDINVAESALESAFWNPPSTPTIRIQYVDVIFCAKEDNNKNNATEEQQEKRQEIEGDKGKNRQLREDHVNKQDESSRYPAQAGAMADIEAMISASLLKEVVQQIGSLVGGQIKLQLDFDKDLNEMKTTLESIEALLKDAEHANTNNSMRLWLNRLKDAMYGIADIIDDIEAETEAEPTRKFSIKKHLAIMMPCFTIGPKFTMANKMKTMREELQGITDQYHRFMLVPGTNVGELKVIQMHETSSTIEASIIGRTEEENKIWVSISDSILEEIIVLAIHGIGGLGKTTLAKMIYNNKTKFEDYVRVWIYVSETFDLNKIGNSLISQLSEIESLSTEGQMIHRSLAKLLANKKILIVLDDLWAEDDSQLNSLIAMLKVGRGSKVVVIATTRNEEIARKFSTIPPHELASLTDEMCWTIIKEKSSFESRDDKEQLKHIGEAIAAKCGGVALAAQSIGPILETMTYNQWNKVRDNDIWKESASSSDPKDQAATRVLASLRLSYTFMPRYLKLCFAYWAIFPKGCKISKSDVIHQWISLSFIVATPTFTAWELGEMYITQLLKFSFLQHSKIVRSGHADVTAFTMHDLVHDIARSVMDDEILLAGNDGNIGGNRCHYVLHNDCSKPLESRRIRALRFMAPAEIGLDDAAFASAKSLRVLDLSECSIHELTDSIGRLKQLRYLNAPRVPHEVIPDSITRLSKLLYLSLRESFLSALPESIGEMEDLMYLDLSGCGGIKELPESFGNLKKLVHLDLSECSALENISKFMWSFTDLQYLNLSNCYRIGWLPESLDGLTSLQYLNLKRCLGEGENDSLMNSISALSNLEHLDLSSNDGITSLPESFCNLRKLHTLNLSYCKKIQKIPESMGRIDSLKTLYLKGCDSLVEKPVPHPSTSFVSLPLFEVCAGDGESSSNLVCLQDTNPGVLDIVCLENVKSAEEAQSIKLMEKNNLQTLKLSWTEGAERFVDDKVLLEKLVPPKSLHCLVIMGYNGVSMPTWVGQQNKVRLTSMKHLQELSVSDSSGMPGWLIINNCPKLRMGPLLPRAVRRLEISGSDNVLSSWGECTMSSTGASSSSSSSVRVLTTTTTLTVGYSELPMQQWRLLRHLSGLENLYITSCADLTVSPDIIPHLSSVTSLVIRKCNISSLPHWFMDLTGLKNLSIKQCEGIRSLPEGIQQLTKLQTLEIYRCPDLKNWCESEENRMKLAHIKEKCVILQVGTAW